MTGLSDWHLLSMSAISAFLFSTDPKPGMLLSEAAAGLECLELCGSFPWALAVLVKRVSRPTAERIPAEAEIYPGGRRSRGAFVKFCEKQTRKISIRSSLSRCTNAISFTASLEESIFSVVTRTEDTGIISTLHIVS